MVNVYFGPIPQRPDSVLVLQFYHGRLIWVHNVKRKWELTGGKLEPGETVIQAAVRESYEESGAIVEPNAISSLGYYVLPTGHVTAVVKAEVLRLEAIPTTSETDDRRLLFAPLPDAEQSFHDHIYRQIFQHIGWPHE